MVGRRLTQHDRNQLELKLAYDIDPSKSKQTYTVEAYLYVPRTLGLTKATYPKERFYEDTSTFVRLKTPTVALGALGDDAQAAMWFEPLESGIDRLASGDRSQTGKVVRRLKMLGCIYRRTLHDESEHLAGHIADARVRDGGPRSARLTQLEGELHAFRTAAQQAVARLRTLGRRCDQAAIPERVRDVWQAVDEYVALVAEEAFTSLVEEIDDLCADEPQCAVMGERHGLAEEAVAEYRYRRGRGFSSFIEPDSENETLPYRRHVLKRTVSSALFLGVRESETGQMIYNAIGMVAAALAMLFAITVTIWAQQSYDIASLAFVLIAVGSYMIKDRIKEWGKRNLGRRAARFLPDKLIEVVDRDTDEVVGTCSEAVSVLSARQVHPDIHALRHMDHEDTAAADGRPETVVRYTKEVSLSSSRLKKRETQAHGLNDIIRFNLNRLRERMDSPFETHRIVDPTSREVVSVSCARVYHVNLVLRFMKGTGASTVVENERVRVVIDQRGIKRIEHIGGTATDLATVGTAEAEAD